MSASAASASPCEMSSCATSAAHVRRNAAPRIATPNSSASLPGATWIPPSRRVSAGTVTAAARMIGNHRLIARERYCLHGHNAGRNGHLSTYSAINSIST